MAAGVGATARLSWPFKVLHWAILLNLLSQIFYAGYMVFFVVRPEGTSGPLWAQAQQIPFEMMVTRRLYAIEFWIAFGALAIYLALTEIVPRLRAGSEP